MFRKLKWYGIIGLTLFSIIAIILIITLDSIVKKQIVVQSSAALNVPVSLGAAHVSIMSESVGLLRLNVGSPQGFSAPSMLTLDAVHTDLNVAHLRAQPLTVDRVVLTAPTLVIEQSGGKLNVQALTDQPSKAPDDGSEPMKLIVKELIIENAKAVLRPGIPGIDKEFSIDIPTFTVKDIGTGDNAANGVALKQVLLLVVNSMAKSVSDSDQLPAEVKALLKLNVKDVINQQVDQAKEKATDEINKQLGKLLKDPSKKSR